MSFGDYWENKILDHVFDKAVYPAPANIYVALSTADPGEAGGSIAEPSGGSYARVSTAPADWNAAAAGLTSNANAITFPEATGSWGTITYWALYDDSSGGNFLGSGALDESKVIGSGDQLKLDAGNAEVTLT